MIEYSLTLSLPKEDMPQVKLAVGDFYDTKIFYRGRVRTIFITHKFHESSKKRRVEIYDKRGEEIGRICSEERGDIIDICLKSQKVKMESAIEIAEKLDVLPSGKEF